MVIYKKKNKYYEYEYQKEEDFENDVVRNSEIFFGSKTIYIDAKKKIKSKALGNSIPDGFLIDLSDADNPEFYIVEAELYKHDFYSHIFPQITKFFAFYRSIESRHELASKIYTIINEDNELETKIRNQMNQTEIYKYIQDMIENSQNILLIIDEEKKELPEIMNTYTDTWGKMVKIQVIKKFITTEDEIFTMEPEFEAIEFSMDKSADEVDKQDLNISEDFHLENKPDDIKKIYNEFKFLILDINDNLRMNPQKYYISIINERNIAFIKIRKKKIRFIIMLPEEIIRKYIKESSVASLSDSVQKFYNGNCAAVDIENLSSLQEIINLMRPLLSDKNVSQLSSNEGPRLVDDHSGLWNGNKLADFNSVVDAVNKTVEERGKY
ncbi:MAG: hypothetical protein GY756_18360 [bacterium]|nr:hypothetical protein [bacterium]